MSDWVTHVEGFSCNQMRARLCKPLNPDNAGQLPRHLYVCVTVYQSLEFAQRFRSVVVITSASHAEGPRFDPGREQILAAVPNVVLLPW